jgi:RNA polymerase sigma-70 factor (ECF subfamily)
VDPAEEVTTLELLRRAPQDRACLDRLLTQHLGLVRSLVRQQLDPRLAAVEEAEDIVQHVLASVTRSIAHASFAHEGAFVLWLKTLVKNRIVDLRRVHLRPPGHPRAARSLDDPAGKGSNGSDVRLADLVQDSGPSLTSVIRREEAKASLWVVLDRLPPDYAAVVRMLRIDGLSTDEVARRLGKQPAAVRKTLSRALDACREIMGLGTRAERR